MEKSEILVFSGFDGPFAGMIKHLKNHVNADVILSSRLEELPSIYNSMNISLTVVNCRSFHYSADVIPQIQAVNKNPIVCLSDAEDSLNTITLSSNSSVFSLSFNDISEADRLTKNISSVLELTQLKEKKEAQSLKGEALLNEKSLCRYVMELDQKNKVLKEIKGKLDELAICENQTDIKEKLKGISRSITLYTISSHYWEDFKVYFEKVNPTFIKRLCHKHPQLTTKDIKYCCYLRMNMSNHDIKNLLNINQESVRTHKYRLKRKLGLRKEEDLRTYFQQFASKTSPISA